MSEGEVVGEGFSCLARSSIVSYLPEGVIGEVHRSGNWRKERVRGRKQGETRSGMHVLWGGKWVGVIPLSCRPYSGTCPVRVPFGRCQHGSLAELFSGRGGCGGAGAVSARCVLGDWEGKDRVGAAVFGAWR